MLISRQSRFEFCGWLTRCLCGVRGLICLGFVPKEDGVMSVNFIRVPVAMVPALPQLLRGLADSIENKIPTDQRETGKPREVSED